MRRAPIFRFIISTECHYGNRTGSDFVAQATFGASYHLDYAQAA